MTYVSPLEKIKYFPDGSFDATKCGDFARKYMVYRGNLEDIRNKMVYNNPRNMALFAPRVLRAAVDCNTADRHKLVLSALDLCLEAYMGTLNKEGAKAVFAQFANIAPLNTWNVREIADAYTWVATNPALTRKNAKLISIVSGGKPVTIISLAHGSNRAAIDLALMYNDITGVDSNLYPLRFSIYKGLDTKVQLNSDQGAHIEKLLSSGNKAILFDDDSPSGRTLYSAQEQLELDFGKRFVPFTNA